MSTVDKKTADDIIAGKYPEDNIVAIIKYNNMFNGEEAYKFITYLKQDQIQYYLDGKAPSMIDCTIYWKKKGI